MRKEVYWPYFFLLGFIMLLISASPQLVESLRGGAIACISPVWGKTAQLGTLFHKTSFSKKKNEKNKSPDQLQLSLENRLLTSQIESVYEWLSFEERIGENIKFLREVSKDKHDDLYWNEFFRRRSEEMKQILEIELQSVPAKVVFRDPTSWSSCVWINVGQDTNDQLGRLIVGKNSPVVLGESLIGVVEYVGKKHSRIRLISDSGLVPSVRAIRGASQDRYLMKMAYSLLERVHSHENIFSLESKKEDFINLLTEMIQNLSKKNKEWYLAKGELYGLSLPLWRGKGMLLKGIGFNYDYSDIEGPARELISGKPIDDNSFSIMPLLREGDLLITTGLDGIFPPNLCVATVTKIGKLKEGSYAFEIEAKPTAFSLEELDIVFVMPPLSFNKEQQE